MDVQTGTKRYRIDETRLASSHLDGEAVVLDVPNSTYFGLNRTAAALWSALTRGATHEELVAELAPAGADAPLRAQISRDVEDFLAALRAEGMLEEA
jgi:hypothetical protein